jgi:mono/diheme cytochrome c family protein
MEKKGMEKNVRGAVRNPYLALALIGLVISLLVVACSPDPQAQLISPNMLPPSFGEDLEIPTPTPLPNIANLSEEEILAELEADLVALFPGDAARGQAIAAGSEVIGVNCVSCHLLDNSALAVAPSWGNMANVAITRKPSLGPAAYLYESIVAPNAYMVSGYAVNIMPQNYDALMTDQDLMDLVTYLLTLTAE